jgi:hypothetical protein
MTKGHTAVMAAKRPALKQPTPWQALEFFPTPPWATRALLDDVLDDGPLGDSVWEPCAGLGHMSEVLKERFRRVHATDVMNYPLDGGGFARNLCGVEWFDFLDSDAAPPAPHPDWIITNPPFATAPDMLENALRRARVGVAFLLRLQWIEGERRYYKIYSERAPTFIAPFVERVPMCEGGWDMDGSTATSYAWFVWLNFNGWAHSRPNGIPLRLIPPGRSALRAKESDRLLARRSIPGWIAPSKLKKLATGQTTMELSP